VPPATLEALNMPLNDTSRFGYQLGERNALRQVLAMAMGQGAEAHLDALALTIEPLLDWEHVSVGFRLNSEANLGMARRRLTMPVLFLDASRGYPGLIDRGIVRRLYPEAQAVEVERLNLRDGKRGQKYGERIAKFIAEVSAASHKIG
jgi:hypothetical protein